MAGVTFAVEGDGVGFATESYAASALYTTLASLSGALWRIRWVSDTVETFERLPDVRYVRGWYEIRKVDVVIIAIGASRKPDTANSNSLHSRVALAFRPCKKSKGPF